MAIWNERIKEKRIELGITLSQVATKLGVTEATAQRYESGNIKSIPYDQICVYAELLNVSPSYIMGWEDRFSKESAILAATVAKTPELKELVNLYLSSDETGKSKILDNAKDISRLYPNSDFENPI